MDDLTAEQRHVNMSHIRSKNTKPEMIVRKYLFSKGFRYRVNDKRYPGHPDIVLFKYRTVIFVNGCFWHQHSGCKYAKIPSSRREYWEPKLLKNRQHDEENKKILTVNGWNVITVWECELKKDKQNQTLSNLMKQIIS